MLTEGTVRAPIPDPPATEGTVRAPLPDPPATEGTVRAPIPTAPESIPPREQTVRARVPTPASIDMPGFDAAGPITGPVVVDPSRLQPVGDGVPVSRSNAPTVPEEMAADEPPPPVVTRVEPPAVSGEVSVVEPEPIGMFDPRPQPRSRESTEPVPQAPVPPTRDDPPAVVGEVSVMTSSASERPPPAAEVTVMPMTPSGPLSPSSPVASEQHVAMHPATFGQRPGTDPGSYAGMVFTDSTGPQPMGQAETTGPHAVVMRRVKRARPDRTLWYVALALVLLAVGGVALVVIRAS
ncbi:MAG: hypothetical protein AAGF11_41520 [Myxococcota bacterium]